MQNGGTAGENVSTSLTREIHSNVLAYAWGQIL